MPLEVVVTDAFGNPISGARVTFTVQPNVALGATGSFSSAGKVMRTSNKAGLVIAPLLRAGSKPGSFTVIAAIAGLASDAIFELTVFS